MCCVGLCICLRVVATVGMVFHCDPIFGSVCHVPGWYSLFGFDFDFSYMGRCIIFNLYSYAVTLIHWWYLQLVL